MRLVLILHPVPPHIPLLEAGHTVCPFWPRALSAVALPLVMAIYTATVRRIISQDWHGGSQWLLRYVDGSSAYFFTRVMDTKSG